MNKSSKNLLIAMLLGDGTVSNNFVFKMSHGHNQKEYLEWKIKLLNKFGIKNNGLKSYNKTQGYTINVPVYYTQLNIKPFIKVLRRVFYKPNKRIDNIKLLNRIDELGLAIWFMDDGHINIRKSKDKKKIVGFYIKISTCIKKEEALTIVEYFKKKWNIDFKVFNERAGKEYYSLYCGVKEGHKFLDIISPHVPEFMKYKITWNRLETLEEFKYNQAVGNGENLNTEIKI